MRCKIKFAFRNGLAYLSMKCTVLKLFSSYSKKCSVFCNLKKTSWRKSIPAKHITKKENVLPFLFLYVAEIQPFNVFFSSKIWYEIQRFNDLNNKRYLTKNILVPIESIELFLIKLATPQYICQKRSNKIYDWTIHSCRKPEWLE